jgi:hypothetical protein
MDHGSKTVTTENPAESNAAALEARLVEFVAEALGIARHLNRFFPAGPCLTGKQS